jgi:uncharacterized protein (DUF433 family)
MRGTPIFPVYNLLSVMMRSESDTMGADGYELDATKIYMCIHYPTVSSK